MRTLKPVVLVLLGAVTACATGGGGNLTPGEAISRLEQEQHAAPTSSAVNRSLGISYYKAGRFAEARTALETASRLDPKDGTASLYLGLTDEALGDLPAARTAYGSYIQFGRTSRVRSQLQGKLAELTQKQITADAKVAVAQEASLASQPGSPLTVAVMPLRFSGADSSLKPLERGFADMLTTDLARSSQLTLVERARMQALVNEITIQQGGATDAATNVRAGRLLRAGRVVQGSIAQLDGSNLRVDAAVVDVPTSQVRGTTQGSDQLEQVFNLEKKVALDLFTQLGVTLTVAERNAIEQRPTRSLAAFLAYSNGLLAEDQGRYDDASRFFDRAVRLDPGFNAAQQKGAGARAISTGAAMSSASVEANLRGTNEGALVSAAGAGLSAVSTSGTGLGATAQTLAGDINPSASGAATGATTVSTGTSTPQKDPVSSGTGSDNPAGAARVTVVITRPKSP